MQLLPYLRHGYALALGTTLAAFAVTLLVGVWSTRPALALYLWAVVVSAYFGGLRAGLLSLLLATVALIGQYQILPASSPLRQQGDVIPTLILFALAGVLACYLSQACSRAFAAATRIKHTIGHMQEAVVLTDTQGRITYLNRAARVLCGCQEAEALGQPFSWVFALLDPKSHRAIDDPATQILKSGHGPLSGSSAILRPRNAPEKAVEFSAEPLSARSGVAAGALVVLRTAEVLRDHEQTPEIPEPLRVVPACAPAGLIVLDPASRCVYSNPACRTVAGFAPDDSLGDGWTRYVHPEDQEFAVEWQQAVRQEKSFATEIRFKGDGGRLRWAQLRAAPLRSDEGRYLGQVGLLEDITLWKELEHDLSLQQKETEDLRRSHREQVQEIEGRLAGIQKAQALLHSQLEEKEQTEDALRRRHDEERAEWHRNEERLLRENADLRRASEKLEEQLAESQNGEAVRGELERVRAEHKRVEDKLRHDLKEQRRARQAAEEVLAELRRGEESRRNDLERQQADWGRSQEKLRKEVADLTETVQLLEAELADWQQKERQARIDQELAQRERDEQRTQLEDAHRHAQEERERNLREQTEREQQWRSSTDWLDRVAERLQPLANDLDETMRSWPTCTNQAALEAHARRLRAFADGLWVAGRLGKNNLLLRSEPTELGALVHRVVEAAGPLVQTRGQHLTVKLPLGPLWLTVDPARTEQALVALLDNAAQFTDASGQIELTAERRGEEIVFCVKDTGRGIASDKMPEILTLDARQRQFSDGLGLGLAVVRGLIEEQGGQVEMVSEGEGCGSVFRVSFPIQSEALPVAEVFEENGPLAA